MNGGPTCTHTSIPSLLLRPLVVRANDFDVKNVFLFFFLFLFRLSADGCRADLQRFEPVSGLSLGFDQLRFQRVGSEPTQ